MRRREAGRGAAPAGFVATKHSGGIGAPPGTNTSPCQELADRPAVAGNGKRGPMPETTAKKHALPAFGLLERVWRAERRQRVSARRHELPDLRFSARQPPHAPDAPGVAERSPHVCRSGATNSIPPLDGEGVALLGATGGVQGKAVDVVPLETHEPHPDAFFRCASFAT
jgi:hypothetical protein